MDKASTEKWKDYSAARDDMFAYTDTDYAPWTCIKSDDKKRARINAMRHVLNSLKYKHKDKKIVGCIEPLILSTPQKFYGTRRSKGKDLFN